MYNKIGFGFLIGVVIGVIILLLVWAYCAWKGSSYNPFVHWWIAFALLIAGFAGALLAMPLDSSRDE